MLRSKFVFRTCAPQTQKRALAKSNAPELVQNSRGPMKLKKPIGIGPYKFPEGFNISGKPGQVYLVLTSGREGSRGSNGHLRLQVNMTSGPPVRMKIRSEGLLQEEFVDAMTVEEQAGFEVRGTPWFGFVYWALCVNPEEETVDLSSVLCLASAIGFSVVPLASQS